MRAIRNATRFCLSAVVLFGVSAPHCAAAAEKIPIIYSTDLFQPHDDPDDHVDLATLFALDEFEILGIIVEHGEKQATRPGQIPVRQMMQLTARQVPCVVGLNPPLKSLEDQALDQPAECQQGVNLLLEKLQRGRSPGDDLHHRQHARRGRRMQSRPRAVAAESRAHLHEYWECVAAGERVQRGSGCARLRAHPAIRLAGLLVPLLWRTLRNLLAVPAGRCAGDRAGGPAEFLRVCIDHGQRLEGHAPAGIRRSARLSEHAMSTRTPSAKCSSWIATCGVRRRSSTPPVARLCSARQGSGRLCRPANRPSTS